MAGVSALNLSVTSTGFGGSPTTPLHVVTDSSSGAAIAIGQTIADSKRKKHMHNLILDSGIFSPLWFEIFRAKLHSCQPIRSFECYFASILNPASFQETPS